MKKRGEKNILLLTFSFFLMFVFVIVFSSDFVSAACVVDGDCADNTKCTDGSCVACGYCGPTDELCHNGDAYECDTSPQCNEWSVKEVCSSGCNIDGGLCSTDVCTGTDFWDSCCYGTTAVCAVESADGCSSGSECSGADPYCARAPSDWYDTSAPKDCSCPYTCDGQVCVPQVSPMPPSKVEICGDGDDNDCDGDIDGADSDCGWDSVGG
jgi:hypothetical protein